MLGLMKYNYKVYIKNNRFIIPLISFCIFQYIYYSNVQEKFLPSVLFCANVDFVIMIWIAFIYCFYQDSRSEETIYLKVNNDKIYWYSKILFMLSIAVLIALLGTLWPSLKSAHPLNYKNISYSFIIQFICSSIGLLLGMILQVKVTGEKNKSILSIIFIALIAMLKFPIIRECYFFKYILWIFPPISDLTFACVNTDTFSLSLLSIPLIYSIIYFLLEGILYYKIMKKLLF